MEEKKTLEQKVRFTPEQLQASQRYADKQDVLCAVLCIDKTYTIDEVDALIEKFMKGKVR